MGRSTTPARLPVGTENARTEQESDTPERFSVSQAIHLYTTGIYRPRFVVECTTGVYYVDSTNDIRIGQRMN